MDVHIRAMTRLLRIVMTGLVLVAGCFAATPFPQEKSDLRADATVRFGTLPNGMRYAIRANAEPKGRAALRLLIEAGSFMEAENQRGLAHFLEHMSFNGSTHYAPGTLIEFFQRMGMNFGGDTNAYTSFDRTVYMIDLPDTKEATLDEGLQVFGDYAGGLLLKPEEIEKERGVILAEKRSRDSVGYRILEADYAFAYAGTRLPLRFPIGLEEVISKADEGLFRDLYDCWYRPELMTIVAVGDFDVATVETMIRARFAEIQSRADAKTPPEYGAPLSHETLRVGHHHEDEAPATEIRYRVIKPWTKKTYQAADILREVPLHLALAMLNQRFTELAKAEGAPFTRAMMYEGDGYGLFREAELNLVCKPEQWKAALSVGEQELRRALTHGFQASELKMAVANMRNGLEQAVKTEATRLSSVIATQLVNTVHEEQVYTSSADDLALIGPALDGITLADCVDRLREVCTGGSPSLFVCGKLAIEGDINAAIEAAYSDSQKAEVEAPATRKALAWTYTQFGAAALDGAVSASPVERREIEDLGIVQVRYANGVTLNIKRTDFEVGQISLSLQVEGGLVTEPADKPGLGVFTSNFFTTGGLGRLSADELAEVLAGRNVGVRMGANEDSFEFSGRTTPEDLELQLQLLSAFLADPGYRPEAERQFGKLLNQYYNRLEQSVEGMHQLVVPVALASGDKRAGLPPREAISSRTLDDMRAWLSPYFASAALELSVVGDIDPEKVIELVGKTLGALPARKTLETPESLRELKALEAPVQQTVEVPTKINKALVALYWQTHTDNRDYHRTRRLSMLANVFEDRLRVKVREELGEAYSPDVSNSYSTGFRKFGQIGSHLMVDPAKAVQLAEIVKAISEDMATKGITEDELQRAKLPVLTAQRQSLRKNSYWLGAVLSGCQENTWQLEAARNRTADTEAISVAELNALASELLGAGKCIEYVFMPALKP